MGRKIRFEKMFDEVECSELIFCGPSNKDGTYAMCMGCPSCGEDIQVVLSVEELKELHGALGRAIQVVEKLNNVPNRMVQCDYCGDAAKYHLCKECAWEYDIVR